MSTVLRLTVLLCLATAWCAAESWNNPPGKTPAGVEHQVFASASMKCDVGFNIYLPEEYAANPQKRYPVIYYVHGRGGNENDNMSSFDLLAGAIREGKIPPLIYVHAMGGRNSGYVDAPDGSVMGETAIIKELIPHVDQTYRTIAAKGGRAIQGFSMGGQGALLFAFKFPELFSSVIGYGAGLASGAELQKELPAVFKQMHGDSVEQFDATSAWFFVRKNADQIRSGVAVALGLGDKDQHLSRNHHMHAVLDELKIPVEYRELPGVGHDTGKVYREIGVDGFVFHAKHFTLPPSK